MLTPREKSPLPENVPRGVSNRDTVAASPSTTNWAIPAPLQTADNKACLPQHHNKYKDLYVVHSLRIAVEYGQLYFHVEGLTPCFIRCSCEPRSVSAKQSTKSLSWVATIHQMTDQLHLYRKKKITKYIDSHPWRPAEHKHYMNTVTGRLPNTQCLRHTDNQAKCWIYGLVVQ